MRISTLSELAFRETATSQKGIWRELIAPGCVEVSAYSQTICTIGLDHRVHHRVIFDLSIVDNSGERAARTRRRSSGLIRSAAARS